ncbi:histidine kinase [Luteimonas sp. SX5]|uniref:histidine kinase n=1 Tax=Luteimonas galliterrae TaxID=2940486 RepID=A0ABT0MI49_9GAMM|nr:histidine kinase [Luteimonas galliterrae]MCL1633970.1 histidine kinase [Luteimonas galliterrae]
MAISSAQRQLATGAAFFGAGCIAQLLSVAAWAPALKAHMVWLPGATLLCGLLLLPRARWPACLIGSLLGVLAVSMFRISAWDVLVTVGGDYLLVAATAAVLLRYRDGQRLMESFADIGRFILFACLLLPATSAWWVTTLARRNELNPYIGDWLNVALAHSLGYVLVVPAVVGIVSAAKQPERRNPASTASFVAVVLLAGLLWLTWSFPWDDIIVKRLLILAPIPFLVWALASFGIAGASVAMLLVAFLCMRMSVNGFGPFAAPDLAETILSAQFWAIGTAISLLFLAVLAEQRTTSRLMLKRAYQRLSKVTGRMLVVQEEERTRIARDLHDDINQSLAAVSIQLSAIKRELGQAQRESIDEIQEQLMSISKDIRDISHELHPSILRFTGLASAIEGLCEKHNASGELRLHCSTRNLPPLSEAQELGLFRIVQEAVNNIDKHAHASLARILLEGDRDGVSLTIEDNGIGYAPEIKHAPPPSLGLISMEERAKALGGNFDIARGPTGGTRVEVRFRAGAQPHGAD